SARLCCNENRLKILTQFLSDLRDGNECKAQRWNNHGSIRDDLATVPHLNGVSFCFRVEHNVQFGRNGVNINIVRAR
ncbi:MAG: hypothetical protein ACPG8W_18265, partial [Candidatus Promineifilaceae bacterium]